MAQPPGLLKKPLKHHRLKPVPHFLPGGVACLWHSLQAVVLHLFGTQTK
jgi:hypothetical protein